jgi:RNA polymerase sigma-70 factor, ECF subfamily
MVEAMTDRLRDLTADFLGNRHHLMAFIRSLVDSNHTAEDIFQEVWIALSRTVADDKPIHDLGKWCRGVARNHISTYWRDRGRDRVIADDRLLELAERSFAEHPEAADGGLDRRRALAACVERLSGDAKDLIAMTYEQDLPAAEVATRLGRTYNAVLMALSRTRRSLERCVQAQAAT